MRTEPLENRRLLTFVAPVDYAAGASPQAVLTADFNNDGRLDLATANAGDHTVSVLLGNPGAPGFQPAQNSATGAGPQSVAVGDFNADGKLDLATANAGDVSVLLGNGNGTFQAPTNIAIGSDPASVAVGDFNADGKLDLGVTSNVYQPGYYGPGYWGYYGYYPGNWYPGYTEGRASVLLGTGGGSFAAPSVSYLGYGYHVSAAVADFNGDGAQDFAAAGYESGSVSMLMGDGQGNLFDLTEFSAGANPWSAAAGDLNGDSKTDLVTANRYGNDVSVLLGNGQADFGPAQHYATGNEPTSVVLGDFNHDNKLDIATANASGSDVSVLRGDGLGGFAPAVNSAAGPLALALAAGDFDGDGWLDAATANANENSASVLINTHDWRALAVSGFPSPTTAGVPHTITVTAENSGQVLTGYTGTVHFASSDPQADLPADYTFTAGDNGSHTFTVTLATAGTQSLTVSDTVTGTITGGQAGIAVNPAAASKFVVAGFPESQTTGAAGTFTVTAFDVFGNQATNYTGTVHFTSSDGSATLPANYTFAAGDYGVVALSATLRAVGTQTLTVTDAQSPGITGVQSGIRVNPLASISGPSYAARNQTIRFTLGASGMPPGAVFTYAIDWNNDNVVDQTVSGPSGTTVDHAYAAGGSYNARVTATANVGGQDYTSYSAFQYLTILAVSATIQTDPANGALKALVIEGTASGETLVLSPAAGNAIGLSINGTSVGAIAAPGGAAFGHLLVYGYGGNDTLRLTGGVTVPAFLFGGDGNDTVDAGGGNANNVLVGGAGADALTGGSRGDLLIGSLGADILRGGAGDDILIGGYTDYDANLTALCALMKEWSRTDAVYSTRVNHLNGSLAGGLNGSYFLTVKTVHSVYDDAAIDSLFGESGQDWFFARNTGKNKDKVNDKSNGEVVTALT